MYGVFYKNKGKIVGPYFNILESNAGSVRLFNAEKSLREIAKKKPLIYKVKVTPIIK